MFRYSGDLLPQDSKSDTSEGRLAAIRGYLEGNGMVYQSIFSLLNGKVNSS